MGYRQFLDVVLVTGIGGVCGRDDLQWTGPERTRQRDEREVPTDD